MLSNKLQKEVIKDCEKIAYFAS